ncbi:MAG: outer membrane protein assembly factor BamC [Candidatus Anaerobiospirillum merdipullorum]|uniref:Outer membrane protein assembly factor BamC n=1 Tax=Candidatus Anaerobiospirillum merdipullorum TaxID=2838450 RepID=A0A9E2KP63_9GAMM|nr:outer membrane protein assembly factor BamC [Candidatus Anaerobiospirillum merdipullorum]
MSALKHTALAAALTLSLVQLSGCSTIRNWWQMYDGDVDTSLREPTGYYDHATATENGDQLVVPAGLDVPAKDRNMELPMLATAVSGPVGEEMDVRAPVVQLRSTEGVRSVWADGESIVWLNSNGHINVANEAEAWALLLNVLQNMGVQPGEITPGAYEMTTMATDYNEFGTPISLTTSATDALRYRQVYRIRVGRNAAGNIGIATSLIGSMTIATTGIFSFRASRTLSDILTPAEQQRFATGFSNQIIKAMGRVTAVPDSIPSAVAVTMDRDNNNQDCFVVAAPYQATWDVLRNMLPDYGFEITEYSISHSSINADYEEPDPEFFRDQGIDDFGLEEGSYIIRVSIDGDRTLVTFYDEDDKPLRSRTVARLYPGFSAALSRAFAAYAH